MSDPQLINALLFMYTESSLHAGTGSSVSAVDLPIQRERATQYPLVQGSGVKGALRAQANLDKNVINAIFGPETTNADEFAGAISVGDARIVLFPVRSLKGVFAYTTSPAVLARLARLIPSGFLPVPSTEPKSALVTSSSALVSSGRIVLEEFTFAAKSDAAADAIANWLAEYAFPQGEAYNYWREKVKTSLVILPDNDFRDFVVSSTEIVTRVRLDTAKKTVASGALWTQEMLPSDTLLVSPIVARRPRAKDADFEPGVMLDGLVDALGPRIQLGGDETTGQGMVALRWS
jgi:CRISPR-associated protein Cmr4